MPSRPGLSHEKPGHRHQRNIDVEAADLSYDDFHLSAGGAVLSRQQIEEKRERLGYCLECQQDPIRLYKIKRNKINPLWVSKEPLKKKGMCMDGVCFVCHPDLDPDKRRKHYRSEKSRRRPKPTPSAETNGHVMDAQVTAVPQTQPNSVPTSVSAPVLSAAATTPSSIQTSSSEANVIEASVEWAGHRPGGLQQQRGAASSREFSRPAQEEPASQPRRSTFAFADIPSIRDLVIEENQEAPSQSRTSGTERSSGSVGSSSAQMRESLNSLQDHDALAQDSLEQFYERSRRQSNRDFRTSSFESHPPSGADQENSEEFNLASAQPQTSNAGSTSDESSHRPEGRPKVDQDASDRSLPRDGRHSGGRFGEESDDDGGGQIMGSTRHINANVAKAEAEEDDQFEFEPVARANQNLHQHTIRRRPTVVVHNSVVEGLNQLIKEVNAMGNSEFAADLILSTMKDNPSDEAVHIFCLSKVWDLCEDSEKYRSSFVTTTAPEDICHSMKFFLSNAEVQEKGCGALWSMCTSSERCNIMARAGAPARIVRAIMEHKEVESLMCCTIAALRCMSPEAEVRASFGHLMPKKYICQAMAIHRNSESLQRDACAFLSNVSVDVDKKEVSVANGEEMDALVQAIAAHRDNASVVESAIFALMNYTFEENNLRTLQHCEGVIEQLDYVSQNDTNDRNRNEAAALLLRLTTAQAEDENLEQFTCASLLDSAGTDPMRPENIDSVMELMDENDWSAKIATVGIQCLTMMARQSQQQLERIAANELDTIMDIMFRFQPNRDVQISACGLLECLAEASSEVRSMIEEARGCERLVSVLRQHTEDEEVLMAAFAALKLLSEEFQCWIQMEQAGATQAIQDVLETNPQTGRLQLPAIEILSNFSLHSDSSGR